MKLLPLWFQKINKAEPVLSRFHIIALYFETLMIIKYYFISTKSDNFKMQLRNFKQELEKTKKKSKCNWIHSKLINTLKEKVRDATTKHNALSAIVGAKGLASKWKSYAATKRVISTKSKCSKLCSYVTFNKDKFIIYSLSYKR